MGSATPPADSPTTTAARAEHRSLLIISMQRIAEANAKVDLARAPYDAARDNLTAVIDEARADLGKKKYTRKRLMSYLEDRTARLRNLLAEEEQRYQDRIDLGLPVHGEQLSLSLGDPNTPAEVKEEMQWEAEGFLLGRAGKLNFIPDGCPPRFHQKVMAAAEKGQDITRAEVGAAMELKKRRAEPAADQKPVDLTEPEPGSPEAKAAERKAVKAMKAGLDKLGDKDENDDFEAPAAELAAQKPRLAIVDAKTGATSGEQAAA